MSTLETNQPQTPAPEYPPAPPPTPTAVAPPLVPLVPMRRSPGLALVLSFFPGLGHLYLGLYQRAFAVFLSFAVAIWLAEHADLGILVAFVWFFAVIDAYRQAQCLNQGLCAEPLNVTVSKTLPSKRGSLGFGLFLLIVGVVLLYNQFYPLDFSFLQDWWPLLLVLAGVYLVGTHLLDRQRQRRKEAEAQIPPLDPTYRT